MLRDLLSTRPPLDPVTVPPTLTGDNTRAWICDREELRRKRKLEPDEFPLIVSWLIEAPWAHPFWHSYVLNLVHLHDLPNVPKPIIHVPGATHELIISALDPEMPNRQQIVGGSAVGRWLTPPNFAAQIPGTTEEAEARVREAVQAIVDHRLSPDTDFCYLWVKRFGDGMLKKMAPRITMH